MSGYATVYFFGAGASRALGVPTTPDLLPAILKNLANGRLFEGRGRSSALNAKVRSELRANLECLFPSLDPPSAPPITDLFSLMDELIVQQQAVTPGLTTERVQQLRRQLERATLWVVANDRARTTTRGVRAAARRFFDRVVDDGRLRKKPSCFITTNYDRIIESCVLRNGSKVGAQELDYGVHWRAPSRERLVPRPTKAPIGVFKLHGSSTWLGCPLCGHIYIRSSMCIYTVAYWEKSSRHNTCHCGYRPLRTVTVAPSLRHVLVESSLASVWQAALEALRNAKRWIFVGYSLPNEDIAIRALLLRALRGRNRPPSSIHVYIHGASGDFAATRQRYQFLFPGCVVSGRGFERLVGLA